MRSADYEFRFENGRRYQGSNDKYHLPNDIVSQDYAVERSRSLKFSPTDIT